MRKLIIGGLTILAVAIIAAIFIYELRGDGYVLITNEPSHIERNMDINVMHPFEENGLWGLFCPFTGKIFMEPQFAWAGLSSSSVGLAFVKGVEGNEHQTGYVDSEGNLIIHLPEISTGHGFSEGLAFVRGTEGREDLTGFIDLEGNLVIPLPMVSVGHGFSEGLAFVRGIEGREDLTGYIDLEGNLAIPLPTAILARQFSHGFAIVIVREWNRETENPNIIGTSGPFIFIDREGNNAFGQEFQSAFDFVDGLARVSPYRGAMFFMNTTGRNAFRREFEFAFEFEGNYAEVTLLDGTAARINRSGRIVRRGLP